MTVTAASFRGAYSNFSDAATFSDAEIAFNIDFALKRHNAERWGELLDNGVMLFVAWHRDTPGRCTRAHGARNREITQSLPQQGDNLCATDDGNDELWMGIDVSQEQIAVFGDREDVGRDLVAERRHD